MNKAISITFGLCGFILVSCTSTPITSGDSTVRRKIVSFPKQGQEVNAEIGGIVHLKADYQSKVSVRPPAPVKDERGGTDSGRLPEVWQ